MSAHGPETNHATEGGHGEKKNPLAAIKEKLGALFKRKHVTTEDASPTTKPASDPKKSQNPQSKIDLKDEYASAFKVLVDLPMAVLRIPVFIIKGDLATKFIALGFIAGIILVISTSGKLLKKLIPVADKTAHHKSTGGHVPSHIDQFLEQEKLHLNSKNLVFLERFSVHMKNTHGNLKVVEMELFIECDDDGTAAKAKADLLGVQEITTYILQNRTYEELVSKNGKEKMKGELVTALNAYLKKKQIHGTIKRAFITDMTIGD